MTLLQAGDHVVVTDNTYGGTYRLFEQVLRKYGLDFTYVDTSDLDALRGRVQAQHEDAVPGDAHQPGAADHRHRRGLRAGARAQRARGGGQHLRQPVRAAAAGARRRPRAAQHHEVPERAQRQHRRHPGGRRATTTSSGCGSSRTPKARSSGRWTRGWCCAAPRRCRCGWSATTPNAQRLAEFLAAHPGVPLVHYPGLPDHTRTTRWRSGRCAGSAASSRLRWDRWNARGRC